ncbi:preprotein translocase subunit YajC [Coprobacter tertius]|uniref:Sec translocon accessory complex subunit YajC n=1 Tax=Coprobacter tertius TaxID=2944915 RepID=A0ABT1MIF2_9BACT|nr:preprotein translocase subunit YajC [Coprobacter tertius]MCP9611844.1 preprotein translocase subunit YajC [Coprobacter tertius]
MTLLTVLLDAAPAGAQQSSPWSSIIMMVALVAIFYFFMIRPQTKKQKEIRKFRESLKVGDRVITAGGIYGKIKEMKDTEVILEIAENVRIRIDKGSIYATAADSSQQQAAK